MPGVAHDEVRWLGPDASSTRSPWLRGRRRARRGGRCAASDTWVDFPARRGRAARAVSRCVAPLADGRGRRRRRPHAVPPARPRLARPAGRHRAPRRRRRARLPHRGGRRRRRAAASARDIDVRRGDPEPHLGGRARASRPGRRPRSATASTSRSTSTRRESLLARALRLPPRRAGAQRGDRAVLDQGAVAPRLARLPVPRPDRHPGLAHHAGRRVRRLPLRQVAAQGGLRRRGVPRRPRRRRAGGRRAARRAGSRPGPCSRIETDGDPTLAARRALGLRRRRAVRR